MDSRRRSKGSLGPRTAGSSRSATPIRSCTAPPTVGPGPASSVESPIWTEGCLRMRRSVVAVVVVALGLAGCSSTAAPPQIATAQSPGAPSATPSVSSVVAQYLEAKRKWVVCMREQSFPLPDPDAKGNVDFSKANLPVKTDPKLLAAMQKCQEFLL